MFDNLFIISLIDNLFIIIKKIIKQIKEIVKCLFANNIITIINNNLKYKLFTILVIDNGNFGTINTANNINNNPIPELKIFIL